ncbi:hypothetical protein OQE61_11760 [Cetobacterium somerae]|uniref:glycosyltransferase family 9 protein n=1 Tax=Cetobacterium somerae TaxID=188913 RepID=UPI002251FEBC|nr:glycosyltransferase family 9 protein [Cetobacterium somerae]MCX3068175.1 hypothetical protein [Cetobacterium somerae]
MAFKWSHFKRDLSDRLIKKACRKVIAEKDDGNKVLIVTMDALGDNLLKVKSIEKIAEFYGKENTYILCKDKWQEIYLKQGYNVFVDKYKNILERIKLYKKLNRFKYKKVIYFIHDQKNVSEEFINSSDKIEYRIRESKDKYILEYHQDFLKEILKKDVDVEELVPDLRYIFNNLKKDNIITVGIGSAARVKTMPVIKMAEIINYLGERYPNSKLILLGSGKTQVAYQKELSKHIKVKNTVDLVDKISLLESLEYIAKSKFFIGYDSGLTNAAFTLKTKYICLHWTKFKTWKHNYEGCVTLLGEGENPYKESKYGCDLLNSITLSQIQEGLEVLDIYE